MVRALAWMSRTSAKLSLIWVRGLRPSTVSSFTPAPTCCFRPPMRFMKNSSRLLPTIARNFTPLQEWRASILGLVQDPFVEVEPSQLPVQVEFVRPQILAGLGLRARSLLGCFLRPLRSMLGIDFGVSGGLRMGFGSDGLQLLCRLCRGAGIVHRSFRGATGFVDRRFGNT